MNTKRFFFVFSLPCHHWRQPGLSAMPARTTRWIWWNWTAMPLIPAVQPLRILATLYGGGGLRESFTGILPDIGADGGTQFQGWFQG
jgi:hypothetical protein